jgi:polar amino acid transport system permease protein
MIPEFGMSDVFLLLQGLKWTIALAVIAVIGGGVMGLGIALLRTSEYPFIRWLTTGYIEVFQGTPLLMQLFVVYYGVSLLNLDISAWAAAALGLTAHASAFLGEIWRGGIEAVAKGQCEASKALGLKYFDRMQAIVLPQAFRVSLPATVGFIVGLIKGTSLCAIIGFTELTRAGQVVANTTFEPFMVFGIVGALYFGLCWPLSNFGTRIERKLATGR